MEQRLDELDGRIKRIPRSPRLRSRTQSPATHTTAGVNASMSTDASNTDEVIHPSPSLPATISCSAVREVSENTLNERRESSLENAIEELSISKVDGSNDSAASVTDTDPPDPTVPINPESPVYPNPADVPLPTVEGDEFADETPTGSPRGERALSLTPMISLHSVGDESDDQGVGVDREPSEPPLFPFTPERHLSPSILRRESSSEPSTVRDLVNATPTPSPAAAPKSKSSESSSGLEGGLLSGHAIQNECLGADRPVTIGTLTSISQLPPPTPPQEPLGDPSSPTTSEPSVSVDLAQNISQLQLDRGDEESDSEMDDEDIHEIYDVLNEGLPVSPYSNRGFQNSLKNGEEIAQEVSTRMSTCQLARQPETDLFKLSQTAKRLCKFDCPAERRIAIIGDSGAGKSSLINSLLHEPELAHRGDHGTAVTSFVTEYRARNPDQTARYAIRVQCSSIDHIKDQLNELLYDLRAFHEPGILEQVSDGSDEYKALQRKSEVAFSTIESLFPEKEEASLNSLLEQESRTVEEIQASLHALADEISWPDGFASGIWEATADSARECRQQISQFMENNLWPLIDRVEVCLSAQVLKTGIILADLPGLRDINLARVRKTESYQQKCDEIFIVANIKRVLSNDGIKPIIASAGLASPKPSMSISLICTYADDIDISSWENDKSMKAVVNSEQTKAIKREMKRAKKATHAEDLEMARIKYKYIWIEARSRKILFEIKKMYQQEVRQRNLNIFCVGNKDYEGHELCYKQSKVFAIMKSGIPELRKFCHSIVSRAQFRAGTHYLETEIPELIQMVKVWIEAADQETPLPIPLDTARQLQVRILNLIDEVSEDNETHFKSRVLEKFRKQQQQYGQSASSISQDWKLLHWSSYQAFMRKSGTHSTAKVGYRCFNNELIEDMVTNLQSRWKMLEQKFAQSSDHLQSLILEDIKKEEKQMQDLQAPSSLTDVVRLKGHDLKYRLQEECSALLSGLRTIHINACTGELSNAFIAISMNPTYRLCAAQSGAGTKQRMYDVMDGKMALRDIFPFIYDQIVAESTRVFDEAHDSMANLAIEMCAQVDRQIRMIRGPESEASRTPGPELEGIKRAIENAENIWKEAQDSAKPAMGKARELGWIKV